MSKEQLTQAVMALPLAERVSLAQDLWQSIEDIRRFLMRRFPYSILYRVEGETVRILVVKHHSRHPDYWKGRLAG